MCHRLVKTEGIILDLYKYMYNIVFTWKPTYEFYQRYIYVYLSNRLAMLKLVNL